MSSSSFEMELMWILIPSPIFSITLTMNYLPRNKIATSNLAKLPVSDMMQ